MNDVQKAIFPSVLVGIVLVLLASRLMAAPQDVLAAGIEDAAPASAEITQQAPDPAEPGPAAEQPTPTKAKAKSKATPTSKAKKVVVKTEIIKSDSNTQVEPAPEPVEIQPAAQESKPEAAQPESSSNGECSLSPAYPAAIQQWCSLIESAASQHNLDPNLIAAVMLQESGGDSNAYSGSGAVGLMQVMPRDGLAAQFICSSGQPCFHNRPSMQELYDPAFNIDYGVRMLAGLINRNGSLRDGLLAYGPMGIGYSYADQILNILANYR
jgi:soluble lytic murein transglycosylase-like protein